MTNKEIFEKVIVKAIDSGYCVPLRYDGSWWIDEYADGSLTLEYGDSYGVMSLTLFDVIFSHDFAKAFWGEGYICSSCFNALTTERCVDGSKQHSYSVGKWQSRLQTMVLIEFPLKYLERFL